MSEHIKLIKVEWYSRFHTIGFALFLDTITDEHQVRFDVIPKGGKIDESIEHIRDHGIPLPERIAIAFFPNELDPVIIGYSIKYKSP